MASQEVEPDGAAKQQDCVARYDKDLGMDVHRSLGAAGSAISVKRISSGSSIVIRGTV